MQPEIEVILCPPTGPASAGMETIPAPTVQVVTTHRGRLVWRDAAAASDPDGRRPRLLVQRVPEAKTVKDRVPLDVHVGPQRREAEVQQVVGLGTGRLHDGRPRPQTRVMLADPEGNERCVSWSGGGWTAPAGATTMMTMEGPSSTAFADATCSFLETSARAGGRGERPGLGRWSVRDLLGHTSRALSTVEAYLDAALAVPGGAATVDLPDAIAYYLAAEVLMVDASAIVERGRAAGAALGDDPVTALTALAGRVLARVHDAPADARVSTPVGVMTLDAYLPTRTVELTVHTCDLAFALGVTTDVPARAAAETFAVLGGLSAARGTATQALLALTGRSPLPRDFTVL